jgi:diaminopimelate epimerase
VLVAAVRRGLEGEKATVVFEGGVLEIQWDGGVDVHMSGPTTTSFSGIFGDLQ